MKQKLVLLVAAFAGALGAFEANAQNADCNTNLSLYAQEAKVKNYEAAYEPWKMVYENCPDLHYANYAYGEKILDYKMDNAADEATKKQFAQDLVALYDNYYKYFGPEAGKSKKYYLAESAIDKAKVMSKQNLASTEEIYTMIHDAFQKDRAHFNSEVVLYMMFTETVDLYKEGKFDLQTVFDSYDDISEKIEDLRKSQAQIMNPLVEKMDAGVELTAKQQKSLRNAEIRTSNYADISGSMDSYLGQLADCDNLIPLYEKDFEAKKTDEEWLNRAASRMTEKECTADPLYAKIVEQLHKLHPSASSAKFLGVIAYKKGDTQGAIKWFKESLELETDNFKNSKTCLQIAGIYSSPSTKSSWAYKALKYNPSNNKAHEIIARAYAASANDCGSTTFEKKAVYWLAAEAAKKAGNTKLKNSYEGLAPSRSEIFDSGMAGKTIQIKCWINKSVKVPSL